MHWIHWFQDSIYFSDNDWVIKSSSEEYTSSFSSDEDKELESIIARFDNGSS